MKKIFVIVLALGFIMAPAASADLGLSAVTEIKVAFLSPQTGPLSAYSDGFTNAGKMAFDELEAANPSITWTWKVYDTETSPEGTTTAMNLAVAFGATFVVGAAGSSNTLAAAAIAKTEKIPLISYASTSPELSGFADDGYLWRVVPHDTYQGEAMSDIAETAGYATAVIIRLDNAYGSGVGVAFTDTFDGEVLKNIPYDPDTIDAANLVDLIDELDPDVVIDVSYATDGSKLFVQMAEQNLNVPVIGGDGVADNAIFDELDGTAEAMLNLVATKPTAIASTATAAFDTAYADAGYSGGIYTGESYDAVMVGAMAVIAADSTDGADIIAKLALTNYEGASGLKTYDANGDLPKSAAAYKIMEVQEDDDGAFSFEDIGTWIAGTLTLDTDFTQKAAVQSAPFPFFAAFVGIAILGIIRKKRN